MNDKTNANALRSALAACAPYFVLALVFSFAINLLALAPTIYMIHVYDGALHSSSVPTLVHCGDECARARARAHGRT